MLELKNVYKTFNPGTINEKRALNGLNLKLNEGDFVTVIGGNGAGKSTMLNAVAGTWPIDEGQILIDNIDVTKLSEHKRAAYLGRVFQDPMNGTAGTMGIEENLALAKRRGKARLLRPGITKAEREESSDLVWKTDLLPKSAFFPVVRDRLLPFSWQPSRSRNFCCWMNTPPPSTRRQQPKFSKSQT